MRKEMYVGVRMTESEVAELDKFAERLKLTRSQLVRNLLYCGIDDLKLAQAFGLVSLVSFIRKNNITAEDVVDLAMDRQRDFKTPLLS